MKYCNNCLEPNTRVGIKFSANGNCPTCEYYSHFINNYDEKERIKILNNLISLDGIGEIQIDSINSFCSSCKNIEIVERLINKLKVNDFKVRNKKGKFSSKTIMFTGGFENMSRSEAKSIVENNGGKVLGTISKKLDILIVGNSKPTKKKIEHAKQLNVKIVKENEWYKILDL